MKMKKSFLVSAVMAATVAVPSLAQANGELWGSFSGNVAVTTDYVFRGISQSDESAALQGGLDWDSGKGFYLGIWGSSVDFNDGDQASLELDVLGGYAGESGNFSYDVGFIWYTYPGADDSLDYNFLEVGASVGYAFEQASVSGGVYYTDDNFGGTGEAIYTTAGVEVPLNESFTASANVAHYEVKPAFGADYNTWDIGLTYSFEWADIDVRYYDVDENFCGAFCDGRGVVTVSRSL